MFFYLAVVAIIALIYFKNSKAHKYWEEKDIRYVRPWPLFGFMASNIFQIKAFAHIIEHLYKTFPEQRYFGCYQFFEPTLLIRDTELIKTIMIKEFETFPEHRSMIDVDTDPLWAKNLFAMKGGEQWREMRSTLSPAFTSSKMRLMFGLMKDIAKQLNEHYIKQSSGTISVEMKDTTTRYANDVIASTAFGITCNSFKNRTNEFFVKTQELTDFKISRLLKFFGYSTIPSLMKFFKFRMFGDDIYNFYGNIIKESIKIREEQGINRPDMIHLLLEARKGCLDYESSSVQDSGFAVVEESEIGKPQKTRKAKITDEDITAQAFLFFFAGFETVSTAMSHLAFELAINTEIQERLIKEVDETLEECGGDVTYEALLGMKYLDMAVTEALRKWPPAVISDRKCTRSFTIEPKKVWEKPLTLDPGTLCMIPIFAIHRDAKNYPDPEKFDPERFSDENKAKIKPYTYLPFGAGPRNCIGSRFALLEMKTFIFYLLSEFELVRTERTVIPLVISKRKFNPIPDKGFWVGLKPRHKKIE